MEEEHKLILVLYHKMSCPFCKKVRDYLNKIEKTVPMKNIDENPKTKVELLQLIVGLVSFVYRGYNSIHISLLEVLTTLL